MRKERLISLVAGDFTKHGDVTDRRRQSKIQAMADCFGVPHRYARECI